MRRVALLSLHSSPLASIGQGDAGGMNLYVRRLADEIANDGLHVDVFTRRTDRTTPQIVERETGTRYIHVAAGPARTVPKRALPLYVPSMIAAIRQFMQTEKLSYDVVHAHYWLSGLVSIRSRAFMQAPIVTMFHTLSKVKEQYAGAADAADSTLRYDGERCVMRRSDVIVGATDGERALIHDLYGVSPREFTVIPPGVDLQTFRPGDRASSRRALGWGDTPVILFVGRFDPMKGLETLLTSFAEVRARLPHGTRLVVVGGGQKDGTPYRKLARELEIDSAVDFRGLVGSDELPLYYLAADLCAAPSVYESFGMAALEAMACGTPVVAFSVGGLTATVRDGLSGILVESGNSMAFGEALVDAFTARDLRAMGVQARRHAQRYSWQRCLAETRALYETVAHQSQCLCEWVAGA